MTENGDGRKLLIAWVSLGAVIGGVVLGVASFYSGWTRDILFFFFVVYLVWLAGHASGWTALVIEWYREKREGDFFRSRMSSVINRRIETLLKDLRSLRGGQGSIELVAVKFYERPVTATYPASTHPLLDDVLPDFHQVIDLLMGDERLLEVSFSHLEELNKDVIHRTLFCLNNLNEYVNHLSAWIKKVVDQLAKDKGTCPSVAYANAKAEYSILQSNYAQMVANLDSLSSAYNNAASTHSSVFSEFRFAVSRKLDDFP